MTARSTPKTKMARAKIHLRRSESFTFCGRRVMFVSVIKPTECVDEATCLRCLHNDDVAQVRNYRRECAVSGIDPDTMEKLR